jgi:hypothetical protein
MTENSSARSRSPTCAPLASASATGTLNNRRGDHGIMLADPDGLLTVDGAGVQADLNVHVSRALLDRLLDFSPSLQRKPPVRCLY